MKVEIKDSKTDKILFTFNEFREESTIFDVKKKIQSAGARMPTSRQSLRSTPGGKGLNDERILEDLWDASETSKLTLYLRDLGPQIQWRTVFLLEYAGPLIIYFTMWLLRQPDLQIRSISPMSSHRALRHIAVACWCGHYVKRLLETVFVHRFSHSTMPLRNLFKNCVYYYGFAAFVAYFTNHPLYTLPVFGCVQICFGLGLFLLGEYGNFCCHLTLRNLRPPGSTVRLVPHPVRGQLLTRLFTLVACPNYTYEVIAWIGFAIMTQSLPAALFAFTGFCQMAVWAVNKLKAYRREFSDFPKNRRAIVPFLL